MNKLTLPKGTTGFYNEANEWIATGSQMGRRSILPDDVNAPCKLRLTRLPFVDGCYDRWGAYWGGPGNVWCAWDDDGVRVFARHDERAGAKRLVNAQVPGAKFYR